MDKQKLIEDLERVYTEHGEPFSRDLYQKYGEHSATTVFRNFGSWKSAREEMGLDRITPRDYSDSRTSNEELLKNLRNTAEKIDGVLTKRDYNELGAFNPSTMYDRFGKWNEAKRKAGLDLADRQKYLSKYTVNEKFFSELDKESAYVLGLYLADGYVSNNSFQLKLKDRDVIEKVKNVIETDAPIECREGKYFDIRINNKEFVRNLRKIASTENKTYNMKIPEILTEINYKHFYRGYFDGDGSISVNKIGQFSVGHSCISKQFLKSLQKINEDVFGTKKDLSTSFNSGTNRFSYASKDDIRKLYSMYDNAEGLYMERKKKVFDKAYDWATS